MDLKKKITIIALVTFFIDQIIKLLAIKYLTNFSVIPNVLSFVYAENKGVAFSMFWGNRWFIIILSFLLLCFLIRIIKKEYLNGNKNDNLKNVTFGFLIGGILGNLFDRIFRSYVVDYVSISLFGYSFPIFNLADVLITIGVILMIICSILDDKRKKQVI